MNQGKLIVGIAILLGISAGLAGYWWNYRVGHRAMEFWGQENARLIRLAPKVEYFSLKSAASNPATKQNETLPQKIYSGSYIFSNPIDLSEARGLIHLRNAILSDDQYFWSTTAYRKGDIHLQHALRFDDLQGASVIIYFDTKNLSAINNSTEKEATLGPLAKSLEQFLARELPRAEQEAAAKTAPE